MIDFTVFSILGIVMVCVLLGIIFAIYNVIDRRMMLRMLRVFLYFLLSTVFVAFYMWGLHNFDRWWVHLLWVLIAAMAVSSLILKKNHLWSASFMLSVNLGIFLGMACGVGGSLLVLPVHNALFVPALVSVDAALMLSSVSSALSTYLHSLRHTQEHYQYLLANGASRVEAILPSVRRSFRAFMIPILRQMTTPIVITPPLLLVGMLLVGYPPLQAVVLLLLLIVVLLSSGLLSTALIILLLNRVIFDRSDKLQL